MLHGVRKSLIAMLAVLVVVGTAGSAARAGCCVGYRGNLDGDPNGQLTLGDLVQLLDVMFISLEPPSCWEAANVDGSQPEGPNSISLNDLTALIDLLFVSLCPPPDCPQSTDPQGELLEHGPCKSFAEATKESPVPPPDCLRWEFDGDNVLTLWQTNAAFNCCPVILADIEIVDHTITITQIDSLEGGGCDCICLYNLTYEVINLEPGTYTIAVVEPYRPENDEVLETTVDLIAEPAGVFCVARSMYPWVEP